MVAAVVTEVEVTVIDDVELTVLIDGAFDVAFAFEIVFEVD